MLPINLHGSNKHSWARFQNFKYLKIAEKNTGTDYFLSVLFKICKKTTFKYFSLLFTVKHLEKICDCIY